MIVPSLIELEKRPYHASESTFRGSQKGFKMGKTEEVIISAVEKFGKENTVDKFLEECTEAMQMMLKYRQGDVRYKSLAEEFADLNITMMKVLYLITMEHTGFIDEYRHARSFKLQCLKDML